MFCWVRPWSFNNLSKSTPALVNGAFAHRIPRYASHPSLHRLRLSARQRGYGPASTKQKKPGPRTRREISSIERERERERNRGGRHAVGLTESELSRWTAVVHTTGGDCWPARRRHSPSPQLKVPPPPCQPVTDEGVVRPWCRCPPPLHAKIVSFL